jgi:hypothetical protein
MEMYPDDHWTPNRGAFQGLDDRFLEKVWVSGDR